MLNMTGNFELKNFHFRVNTWTDDSPDVDILWEIIGLRKKECYMFIISGTIMCQHKANLNLRIKFKEGTKKK